MTNEGRVWTRFVPTKKLVEVTRDKGYGKSQKGLSYIAMIEIERELRRRAKKRKKDAAKKD